MYQGLQKIDCEIIFYCFAPEFCCGIPDPLSEWHLVYHLHYESAKPCRWSIKVNIMMKTAIRTQILQCTNGSHM